MPENKIHTRLRQIKDFWNRTLWDLDLNPLSPIKRRGIILLRIFAIILKSFRNDKCPVHAAALTNITLMSLVPALAFIFALAKGFYPPDKLSRDFRSSVSDLTQDIQDVLVTLLTKVQETDFSTMGTISFVLIIWTVLSLLGKIEATFNGIWGIKNNRKLIVKVKEYFFTLLIVPTILAITTSINTALKNPDLIDYLKDLFGTFYLLYNVILVLLTPLTVTAAFTYLYMFLPNTKVKFIPAVGAGFITALLWISLQWLYVTFQIGVASNNAIYGTFASIPLFLAWLSSCWMLILLGAEISFAIQNYNTYEDENLAINYSNTTKLNLAVCLTRDAADYFFDGRQWNAHEVLYRIGIPVRLGNQVLKQLVDGHILKCIDMHNGEYLPAKDLQHLNLYDVHRAINGNKDSVMNNIQEAQLQRILELNEKQMQDYNQGLKKISIFKLVEEDEV